MSCESSENFISIYSLCFAMDAYASRKHVLVSQFPLRSALSILWFPCGKLKHWEMWPIFLPISVFFSSRIWNRAPYTLETSTFSRCCRRLRKVNRVTLEKILISLEQNHKTYSPTVCSSKACWSYWNSGSCLAGEVEWQKMKLWFLLLWIRIRQLQTLCDY